MDTCQISCPLCRAKQQLQGWIGKTQKCLECGRHFTVPSQRVAAIVALDKAMEEATTSRRFECLIDALATVLYFRVLTQEMVATLAHVCGFREQAEDVMVKARRVCRRRVRVNGLQMGIASICACAITLIMVGVLYLALGRIGKMLAVFAAFLAGLSFLGLFRAIAGWPSLGQIVPTEIARDEPLPNVCAICGKPGDYPKYPLKSPIAIPVCAWHRWQSLKDDLLRLLILILVIVAIPFVWRVCVGAGGWLDAIVLPGIVIAVGVLLWISGRTSIVTKNADSFHLAFTGLSPRFIAELVRLRSRRLQNCPDDAQLGGHLNT